MGSIHFGLLFILGLSILGGTLGAWIFQRLRVPQVVGYIVAGLLVGESGFRFVTLETVNNLQPFSLFALGLIGFLVGAELKLDSFRRYGKQFLAILLGEGLSAFFLVLLFSGGVLYYLTGNVATSLAAGIVLGAIASATDPASTINVLWEYRCRGILTTSITAIVALDDALAMTLYALGTGTAAILVGSSNGISGEIIKVGGQLGGALSLGVIVALALNQLLRWLKADERTLALALGAILLMIGIADAYHLDVILASMACGFAISNLAPKHSEGLIKVIRGFSGPIYVLFFVLIGARLVLHQFTWWMGLIVALYVLGRSFGKISGAYFGARFTGSPDVVRKYLGLGLFAQGGVAVGLSIVASQRLQNIQVAGGFSLGDAVIFVVTATTIIVQVLGPPMVKYAAQRAGESGKNRTEEDILAGHKVSEWMSRNIPSVTEDQPVREVIGRFSIGDTQVLFVLDRAGELLGVLPIQGLRDILQDPSAWEWMLVSDLMEPADECCYAGEPVADAVKRIRQAGITQSVVFSAPDNNKPLGILDLQEVRDKVNQALLEGTLPPQEKPLVEKPAPVKESLEAAPESIARQDLSRLMQKLPCLLQQDEPLSEVTKAFREHSQAGILYVIDGAGKLAGMVSRRHLLEAMYPYDALSAQNEGQERLFGGQQPLQINSLRDLLEPVAEVIREGESFGDILRKVLRSNEGSIPVVDQELHPVSEINTAALLNLTGPRGGTGSGSPENPQP